MGVGNENGFFNHNWCECNFEIEINEKIEGGEHGEQTKIFAISKTIAHWWYTVHIMGPMSFCSRIIIFMQFMSFKIMLQKFKQIRNLLWNS